MHKRQTSVPIRQRDGGNFEVFSFQLRLISSGVALVSAGAHARRGYLSRYDDFWFSWWRWDASGAIKPLTREQNMPARYKMIVIIIILILVLI